MTPDRINCRQPDYRGGRHDVQVYIGKAGQASETLSGLPAASARDQAVGQDDSRQVGLVNTDVARLPMSVLDLDAAIRD